jgi:transcriptional regulator with XRE-family HTH domain
LAYHSGVSWSAIAQIESGRRQDVRLSSLTALADALGVSVDYLAGTSATLEPRPLEHLLLTYGSDEEYLAVTIPYIAVGLERSEAVLVVTTPTQIALVREALGERSEHVEFADSTEWYRTLSGALNGYRAFVKQKFEAGMAWMRIVGDPVWARRSGEEVDTWFRYESLVNLAFVGAPASILCTYDTRTVPAEVIADARRTHPDLAAGEVTGDGPEYQEPEVFLLGRHD